MSNHSQRLLIVGGTGFIGKNLTLGCISEGYDVSVISLNKPKSNEKVRGAAYFTIDICNMNKINEKLPNNKFDYVVNLSGYVNHSNYFKGGKGIIETHFNAVINLIDYLDKGTLKKFIQIGSSDEYGSCEAPQSESMRENPISPYSFSKVAAGHFLQMLHRTEKFPSVILRLFLVYGPGQDKKRFIPQIIDGCLNDLKFDTSNGDQIRDFCHIDDVVKGILYALKNMNINGEIINLASGNPIKLKNIIDHIRNLIGKGLPQYGAVPYRMNENMELYADITKAKELLLWKPSIPFEDGIKKMIQQHYKGTNHLKHSTINLVH
jgi:nucleoside-diphosphate-sugar epimerase